MYDGKFAFAYETINGLPGLRFDFDDGNRYLYSFAFRDGRIETIYCVANPEKLRHVLTAT
ncbi:hypothetical protein RB620_14320 [Paenibacillus sp. LHD-117]|uniref:hypothetical protein n=1 Tax=Paenibacillus sp. LHD-117 TaxID=3071412 RepID=UPI0027DF8E83|nr:hypothetical protein [Paenibacillus sp. LHD-117]MDQ6420602.1 hypothetical protein [Paenibacillus sp. LHD-117]